MSVLLTLTALVTKLGSRKREKWDWMPLKMECFCSFTHSSSHFRQMLLDASLLHRVVFVVVRGWFWCVGSMSSEQNWLRHDNITGCHCILVVLVVELTSNQLFLVARCAWRWWWSSDMGDELLFVANYFDTGVDGGARDWSFLLMLGQLLLAGVFESAINTWHAFFLSSIGNGHLTNL